MNIHEYQAKQILKKYGAPVSDGVVIFNTSEINTKVKQLNSKKFVLKAQIHAGGRGKAGGVKLVKNIEYIKEKIRNEIRVGINNKDYLSDKDAELIRNFIEKIQKELTDKN